MIVPVLPVPFGKHIAIQYRRVTITSIPLLALLIIPLIHEA
jgi:hypothetical protein